MPLELSYSSYPNRSNLKSWFLSKLYNQDVLLLSDSGTRQFLLHG